MEFLQDFLFRPFYPLGLSGLTVAAREVFSMCVMGRMLYFLGLAGALVLGGFSDRPRPSPRDEPTVTRAIQIDLPSGGAWPVAVGADHAVFYVPVVGKGEMLGVIAVSKEHFVGVRIIPNMREDKDSVKIEVSALVMAKKTLSEASSNEVRTWQSEDAGSYEAKKDESLALSGLGRLGLPVFRLKVIESSGLRPPGGGNRIFCGCESTRDKLNDYLGVGAAPEPGKCVEIGKCARCCRVLLP